MYRFTISYTNNLNIEGVQWSDGGVTLNGTVFQCDFDNVAHLQAVLKERNDGMVPDVQWIDIPVLEEVH